MRRILHEPVEGTPRRVCRNIQEIRFETHAGSLMAALPDNPAV